MEAGRGTICGAGDKDPGAADNDPVAAAAVLAPGRAPAVTRAAANATATPITARQERHRAENRTITLGHLRERPDPGRLAR
jgi:hypothetical protein